MVVVFVLRGKDMGGGGCFFCHEKKEYPGGCFVVRGNNKGGEVCF